MIELKDEIMYMFIGVVIGFSLAVFVVPSTVVVLASPIILLAGYLVALVGGILIGRQMRPKRGLPMRGRAYPLSVSEVGLILEYAMKSIGGGEK
jgi:hypothetical protein